jgi:hypothetical protein
MCLLEPSLPAACRGGAGVNGAAPPGGGLACYAYSEAAGRFVFWGPNALVRLVSPALVPPQAAA